MKIVALIVCTVALIACEPSKPETKTAPEQNAEPQAAQQSALSSILEMMPDEHKARYAHRRPEQTLSFFGIEAGMTVVEVLPGQGWYSQILAPLLGPEGTLIGADYSFDMWPHFDWVSDEFIAKRQVWPEQWPAKFEQWGGEQAARPVGTRISEIDPSMHGTADAVLFIRALHNLARFEDKGQFLSQAIASTHAVLKPGGIVGVVQHEARADKSDEWADGSRGYLKKSFVVQRFTDAGFEWVAETDINQNPKDLPGDDEKVWRLPPNFASLSSEEDKARVSAIGESNRMTLLFKKI